MIVYDRLHSTYRVLRHSELPPLASERIVPSDPRPAARIISENREGIWRKSSAGLTPMADKVTHYRAGDVVEYSGKTYIVGSAKLGLICGPHYRLVACGDYPGEDLTSASLLHPVTREK